MRGTSLGSSRLMPCTQRELNREQSSVQCAVCSAVQYSTVHHGVEVVQKSARACSVLLSVGPTVLEQVLLQHAQLTGQGEFQLVMNFELRSNNMS